MSNDDKKIPDYLDQLMKGCSSYTKIANQYWIALAFFSLVTIYPSIKDQSIEMPFGLGHYKPDDFYTLAFVIDSILLICFGSTFSQAMRARKLIRRAVKHIQKDYIFQGPVHLDDLVDVVLFPALNRLAPIAQALQGKYQFLPEARSASIKSRLRAFWFYFVMKILSIFVLYGFPGYAIGRAFDYRIYCFPSLGIFMTGFLYIMAALTAITIGHLIKEDVCYAWGVRGRILDDEKHNNE